LTWKISYGDSSSASGIVSTDNVTTGGLTIKNQAVELANQMSDQFIQGAGDGLLGLAWGSINTVTPKPVQTPVQNIITEQEIPQSAELFIANLDSWRDANEPDGGKSFYTFGYIDQDTVTASGQEIAYTPADNSQGFWMFSSTYDSTQQGYTLPSSTTVDNLPVVTFAVGDTQFAVQKEDLGFADAGNGMVYGGIQSRGSMTFNLGDAFLKGIYAVSLIYFYR
jgi:hypothetical protein